MSDLETQFHRELKWLKLPEPKREYRFHLPRRWRFDFAWPFEKVAVEIEGGTYTNGRHTRPKGFHLDCEKYNTAAKDGWKVFRFTSEHVTKGEASKFIEDYFNGRS